MSHLDKKGKAWHGKYLYSISAPGFVLSQTSAHSWLMLCNIFVETNSALQEDWICFYIFFFSEVRLIGWICSLDLL